MGGVSERWSVRGRPYPYLVVVKRPFSKDPQPGTHIKADLKRENRSGPGNTYQSIFKRRKQNK